MRHHDIERLKEAARRYAANKYTVGDMEELSEFACNALFEPPCSEKIRKVDNGDGTETWYGLPVVVPVGLVPDDETPVDVRSRTLIRRGRRIGFDGKIRTDEFKSAGEPGGLRITLADKPQPVTWAPPASLSDGDYKWNGSHFSKIGKEFCVSKSGGMAVMFRDWTDPPRCGLYKVESGTATWSGE